MGLQGQSISAMEAGENMKRAMTKEPADTSSLQYGLNMLDEAVTTFQDEVHALEERIHQFLRPDHEAEARVDESLPGDMSDVGNRVAQQVIRLNATTDKLRALRRRIDQ